jgi:hypothetical protein
LISQGKGILQNISKTKRKRVINLTTLMKSLNGLFKNGSGLTMAAQQKIKARLDMSLIIQEIGKVMDQLRNLQSL